MPVVMALNAGEPPVAHPVVVNAPSVPFGQIGAGDGVVVMPESTIEATLISTGTMQMTEVHASTALAPTVKATLELPFKYVLTAFDDSVKLVELGVTPTAYRPP